MFLNTAGAVGHFDASVKAADAAGNEVVITMPPVSSHRTTHSGGRVDSGDSVQALDASEGAHSLASSQVLQCN